MAGNRAETHVRSCSAQPDVPYSTDSEVEQTRRPRWRTLRKGHVQLRPPHRRRDQGRSTSRCIHCRSPDDTRPYCSWACVTRDHSVVRRRPFAQFHRRGCRPNNPGSRSRASPAMNPLPRRATAKPTKAAKTASKTPIPPRRRRAYKDRRQHHLAPASHSTTLGRVTDCIVRTPLTSSVPPPGRGFYDEFWAVSRHTRVSPHRAGSPVANRQIT